jgi:glycyl-tRNA synthetase (class II)
MSDCGGDLMDVRKFFYGKNFYWSVERCPAVAYLRQVTAQCIFTNFKMFRYAKIKNSLELLK